jgi:hypothetical protein
VWDRTVIPLRDQIFPIKDLFGRAILQTTLPKEEPEEPFFFYFYSKKWLLPFRASLLELFSEEVFDRASP